MTASFSLSFLDIMFCGFGAVVLLVLVINSNIISRRQEQVRDLRNQLKQEEITNRLVRAHRKELQQQHQELLVTIAAIDKKREDQADAVTHLRASLAGQSASPATEELISRLQDELKILQEKTVQLSREKARAQESGRQVRPFEGTGHRQYLTGLKLGGKRVLILVDSSASMLGRTIVDIVRQKVMGDSSRRLAPKWIKAVSTVEWIIANLPVNSSIQVFHFSEDVLPLAAEDRASWLAVTESAQVDDLLAHLKQIAPIGGTNLEGAFLQAARVTPLPDNIILVTDGLPTRRTARTSNRTIDSAGRVKLFHQAVKKLPAQVPVNVILFPMEGDPLAAVNYWKLAVDSGGSFLTPTRDWP